MPGLIAIIAVLAGTAVAIAGGPLVILWAAALASIGLAVAPRVGPTTALGWSVAAFFTIELILLYVSPLIASSVLPVECVVWSVVGVATGVLRFIRPPDRGLLDARKRWLGLACSVGSVVVLAAALVAQVLPDSIHLAWAMNADSVNVIGFARRMLVDAGIDPRSTPQPTPLPFAMVASNMASGRSGLADSAVLKHDVTRMAEVWIFVIALCCLTIGVLVAKAAQGMRLLLAIPVTVVASLAGLSWYFIGVQFDGGFINSAFALVLLLAGWLVYVGGGPNPVAAIVALAMLSTVLLMVWSPLVVCLAALALMTFVKGFSMIRRRTIRGFVPIVIAVAVFGCFGAVFVLPGLFGSSAALAGNGGFPAIGPVLILAIVAGTVALASVTAGTPRLSYSSAGALTLVVAFALGLGFLLFQRRGAESYWGYYPAKYAWTVSMLLIVIATTFVVAIIARTAVRPAWSAVTLAAIAVLFATLMWTPGGTKPLEQVPLAGIVHGGGGYNRSADAVFASSGVNNGRDVFWRSSEGDVWINYWLLQTDIPQPATNPVKAFASITGTLTVQQMCTVIRMLGSRTVVHTADPGAGAELRSSCPAEHYTVILEH